MISRLTEEIAKAKITSGAITSIIGAVAECVVSTMPKGDASKDIIRTYAEPLEMFGTGEVIDGKPHVHAVFGTEDGTAVAGHLHSAIVREWFVHAFVISS